MQFARIVFTVAGIYGLLVIAPQFFLEARIGVDDPPAITHPEYFYGFVGVALAWQLVFLVIGRDPLRYRPLMLVALVEKWSFAAAAWILFAQGRVSATLVIFGTIDFVLGCLFLAAWRATRTT
jgi:hypothetical protein